MRVIVTTPIAGTPYGEITQNYPPETCAMLGWTEASHYIPREGYSEFSHVVGDDVDVDEKTKYRYSDDKVVTDTTKDLFDHKWDKKQEIAAARWNAVNKEGVEYMGIRFHTDQDARLAILEAMAGLKERGELAAGWKGMGGEILPLTPEVFVGLAEKILTLKQVMFEREFALAAQVDAAETVAEVEAIAW